MLKSPTPQQLRALAGLQAAPGWADLSALFEKELAATLDSIVESRDDTTLRQMQGRAQLIKEFLRTAREARATLERLGVSTL